MRKSTWALIFCFFFMSNMNNGCCLSYSQGALRKAGFYLRDCDHGLVEIKSQESKLLKVYTLAINQFIKIVEEREKVRIDTMFINERKNNQPDDFPDIKLPTQIMGRKIIMVNQREVDSKKYIFKKSTPFINLIGMENESEFEFVFVCFYPEYHHSYDCYINYKLDKVTCDFDLKSARIEILIYDKNGKPSHYDIYKDGKLIGTKPVN